MAAAFNQKVLHCNSICSFTAEVKLAMNKFKPYVCRIVRFDKCETSKKQRGRDTMRLLVLTADAGLYAVRFTNFSEKLIITDTYVFLIIKVKFAEEK